MSNARLVLLIFSILTLSFTTSAQAVPIVFSGAGSDAPSILAVVASFEAALGGVDNGNTGGPLPSGFRTINWDGGGATNGTAAVTPFTVFGNTRGSTFTTPGSGLTQTPITGGTVDIMPGGGVQGSLAAINPTYATSFQTFSPLRLFTPVGSNITDASFFVPGSGTTTSALVSGFGAVFTDVDLANTTSIQFFDSNNASLGTFFAPTANNGLSFLGVSFGSAIVSSVRITTGNAILGPNDGGGVDIVVMDDFIYGEPQATAAVPEPSAFLFLVFGLTALWLSAILRSNSKMKVAEHG